MNKKQKELIERKGFTYQLVNDTYVLTHQSNGDRLKLTKLLLARINNYELGRMLDGEALF